MSSRRDRRRSLLGTLRVCSMLWLLGLEVLLGLLMAGSEVEASGVSEGMTSERPRAFRYEALHTGTVDAIRFKTPSGANSTATSVRVGIFTSEGAGATNKPGAFVAGSEGLYSGSLTKETLCEVTGLSAAVTSGTLYWIVLLGLGGSLRIKATEAVAEELRARQAAKVTEVKSATGWEPVGTSGGPIFLSATGTEASSGTRTTMLI